MPLLLLPSFFPNITVFSNKLALCIRWPKYRNFSISPSNEYSGLISFRIDWIDLLAVEGTQESSPAPQSPQFENINSLVLSLLYSPTLTSVHDYWKNHSLNIRTFVDKIMSLLFNMLSKFVIAFLPKSKHLLISWLQSPSTVILDPKKIKSVTVSTFSPFICHEVMGPDAMILKVFECWVLSQYFQSSLSPTSRGSLVPLYFLPSEWYHLQIWGCWYFSWQTWFQLMIHSALHFAWCTLHRS